MGMICNATRMDQQVVLNAYSHMSLSSSSFLSFSFTDIAVGLRDSAQAMKNSRKMSCFMAMQHTVQLELLSNKFGERYVKYAGFALCRS